MSLLTFENIKNSNWYIIPGLYVNNLPQRIYKTIYNRQNYIKTIATTDQQEILLVQDNEPIFLEPDENRIDELDDEEIVDDDYYIEELTNNQLYNFRSYPNYELNITEAQKLELYNIFLNIEKNTQKVGGNN